MTATPRMGFEFLPIHCPAHDSNCLSSNPQWGIAHFTHECPPPGSRNTNFLEKSFYEFKNYFWICFADLVFRRNKTAEINGISNPILCPHRDSNPGFGRERAA